MNARFNRRVLQQTLAAGLAAGGALLAVPTQAATATATMGITAEVTNNCTISAALPVAFGNYDSIGVNSTTALAATGTVSTTCTTGAEVTIGLGSGLSANAASTADAPLREMQNGSSKLSYNLYSDAAHTKVWGTGVANTVSVVGTGAPVDSLVYGSAPAGQNLPAGSYADTVVASVTF